MEHLEVELFTPQVNNAVLRLPQRRFPGVLIAGDTLSTLAATAQTILERARETNDDELRAEAEDLTERLREILATYESVMKANDRELPYTKEREHE